MKITHGLANRGQEKVAFSTYLFASPLVLDHFEDEHSELARDLKRVGVKFTSMCALFFTGLPGATKTEFCVTNSNKAREYSTSRFFEDDTLLEIILSGEIPTKENENE
jgi:extradiol dioxygenase family protein